MKKKIIAIILAAAMSCQPVMIYAAESDFSGTESIFVDDVQTGDSETDNNMPSDSEDSDNEDEAIVDEIDIDDTTGENFGDENNVEIESEDLDADIENTEVNEIPETEELFTDSVSEKKSEASIYVENLEQIYWPQSETEQFVFVIDGRKYNITNNVNLSIDHFIGEQVVYTLADEKIDNIEPISELVQPCIAVNATPDSFFYQNGGYNTDKITATVRIYCKYQAYSEYFGESKYTKEELQEISGLSIPVKQVNLKIGDHLNFGTTGMIFKKEITEVSENQINLSLKNPISYKYDIYVENKYVPTETIEKSALSATLVKEDGTTVECKDAIISIGNQDQQQKQLVAKNKNTDKNKAFTEMQKNLMNCTAIALDANLDEYFSAEQIDEMKRFIAVYAAEIINADYMEDTNFFHQVSDNLRKKVRDSILKKLHVTYSSFVFYRSTDIIINMEGETKNNGNVRIKFDIPMSSYSSGDNSPFAAMAQINYSVSTGNSSLLNGTGIITYANMETFANTMLDYLQIAYDEAWGDKANEIASMFVQEPISTLMDGDYSGKIYKLARNATTGNTTNVKSEAAKQTSNYIYRYGKKVLVHCPVNVYVYDNAGNLCASVVDDTIVDTSDEVFVAVNGDQKYVYLTKDNYKIKLEGTAQGMMEYSIEEYQDGECIRKININNVPLEKGTEYTTMIPAIPRINNAPYCLMTKDNNEINVTKDTYDDSDEEYKIVAKGKCGDDAWYELYEDGLLRISGTGKVVGAWKKNGSWNYWTGDFDKIHDKIRRVLVENGITEIGESAFWGGSGENPKASLFANIWSVEISDSVKIIGKYAFNKCLNLKNVYIGTEVEEIGNYAFSYTSLKHIMVSDNNKYFKVSEDVLYSKDMSVLYHYCSDKKSFLVPGNVQIIGVDAFGGNNSLERIDIPSSVSKIKSEAFSDWEKEKELHFSGDAPEMGSITFSNSKVKIYCPEDWKAETILKDYGGEIRWFKPSGEITFVVQDSKLMGYIGNDINVIVPENLKIKIIDGFSSNKKIESVKLPKGVETIDSYAFNGCKKLKSVIIPEGVTNIKRGAFEYCNRLANIDLPKTIKKIEDVAFLGTGIKSIKINGNPEIGYHSFGYDADWEKVSGFTIYGKKNSSVEQYAQENGFKFIDIDSQIPSEIKGPLNTKLSKTTLAYNGKTQTPSITVTYKGKKLSNKYYAVKYTNNKNIGTATVTVTGKGTYKKCSGKAMFKIVLRTGAISSLKAGKKYITLNWKTITGSTGYQIQYSISKNFAKAKTVKIAGAKKHSTTIKKLTSKKTYYVRVRAYRIANRKTVYGSWSGSKKVVVK